MNQEIPNVETASLQEIFDFVTSKLIEQNAKSTNDTNNNCMYRGTNGRRCAAGWLIPDERYNKDLEFCTILSSVSVVKAIIPNYDTSNEEHLKKIRLISLLQKIHDGTNSERLTESWKSQFINLASSYKLKTNF